MQAGYQTPESFYLNLSEGIRQTGASVEPLWWDDLRKVNLPNEKEYLRPDSMFLIRDVPVSSILVNLWGINAHIFNPSLSTCNNILKAHKLRGIIEHWRNAERLLPPSICYSDHIDKIDIADGTHRLHLARFLGAKAIPILVRFTVAEPVLKLLNLSWENILIQTAPFSLRLNHPSIT